MAPSSFVTSPNNIFNFNDDSTSAFKGTLKILKENIGIIISFNFH